MKITNASNPIEAIYYLLATGNVYYRAAAILLLKEYASTLTANGKGEFASRLVQEYRDTDPHKRLRPRGSENRLRP